MNNLIGRKQEQQELKDLYESGRAEFVAVYGRRRVGKTYLIDETLGGHLSFRHAGLSPIDDHGKRSMLICSLSKIIPAMMAGIIVDRRILVLEACVR